MLIEIVAYHSLFYYFSQLVLAVMTYDLVGFMWPLLSLATRK